MNRFPPIAAIMASIVRSTSGYKPPFPIPKTPSAFHRLAQPNAVRRRGARQQSRSFAPGEVTKKSSGVGFNFNNWYQFLMKLRYLAKKLRVSARDIERSLFFAHQANQKGTLYQRPRKSAAGN